MLGSVFRVCLKALNIRAGCKLQYFIVHQSGLHWASSWRMSSRGIINESTPAFCNEKATALGLVP